MPGGLVHVHVGADEILLTKFVSCPRQKAVEVADVIDHLTRQTGHQFNGLHMIASQRFSRRRFNPVRRPFHNVFDVSGPEQAGVQMRFGGVDLWLTSPRFLPDAPVVLQGLS